MSTVAVYRRQGGTYPSALTWYVNARDQREEVFRICCGDKVQVAHNLKSLRAKGYDTWVEGTEGKRLDEADFTDDMRC
jgi:hypothetical protein